MTESRKATDECTIGIIPSITDFFVLGDSFMRGFYTICADNEGLVGLVPHATSTKKAVEIASVLPTRPIDVTNFFGLTQIEIGEIVGGTLALAVVIFIIIKCFTSKQDPDEKNPPASRVSELSVETFECDISVLILPYVD